MRIQLSQTFVAEFVGREGHYSLRFTPFQGSWDGLVEVVIADVAMKWSVERIDRNDSGQLSLSGMTATEEIWNDSYWFEAIVEPAPGQITYYGNQVVWRVDPGA